jgi:hypothetical protein
MAPETAGISLANRFSSINVTPEYRYVNGSPIWQAGDAVHHGWLWRVTKGREARLADRFPWDGLQLERLTELTLGNREQDSHP